MRSKGITDIIAIVLLLMITISMVGFAWMWLQRLTVSAQNTTQGQINTISNIAGQQLKIDNVDKTNGNLTVRNTGTSDVRLNTVGVYKNGGTPIDCGANWANFNLVSGSTATCNATAIQGCITMRITSASGEDSTNC